MTSVPPVCWTISWPATSGTCDASRLDRVKTSKPVAEYGFKAGVKAASVCALSKSVVCDTPALKGSLTVKQRPCAPAQTG